LPQKDFWQGEPPSKLAGVLHCVVGRDHSCNLTWDCAMSGAPPPSFGWSPSPEGEECARPPRSLPPAAGPR
jgi:hypothetical protein